MYGLGEDWGAVLESQVDYQQLVFDCHQESWLPSKENYSMMKKGQFYFSNLSGKTQLIKQGEDEDISGLYYKRITIIIDTSRVASEWSSKLWHHML